jgi:putative ATPase
MAKQSDSIFKELSATAVGINDVRAVFEEAKATLSLTGRYGCRKAQNSGCGLSVYRKTCLFLDEVHRFNKAQQVGLSKCA